MRVELCYILKFIQKTTEILEKQNWTFLFKFVKHAISLISHSDSYKYYNENVSFNNLENTDTGENIEMKFNFEKGKVKDSGKDISYCSLNVK